MERQTKTLMTMTRVWPFGFNMMMTMMTMMTMMMMMMMTKKQKRRGRGSGLREIEKLNDEEKE